MSHDEKLSEQWTLEWNLLDGQAQAGHGPAYSLGTSGVAMTCMREVIMRQKRKFQHSSWRSNGDLQVATSSVIMYDVSCIMY